MQRHVEFVGFASGAGGADASCADAPAQLAALGLVETLRARGLRAAWSRTLRVDADGDERAVRRVCEGLATQVAETIGAGRFPCVLGGDHACAVGTWAGASRAFAGRGPFGLIWIDAHMDSHTPRTSPSGRLHGMPLAALLGEGDNAFAQLGARLSARNVCIVGVRSFEQQEAVLLERLGARVFFMQEISQRGLDAVMREALEIVMRDTAAFGATLDMDALDPADAPAVATPAPGGLRAGALLAALARIAERPGYTAFELAEYSPRRDRDGRTARLIVELVSAATGAGYAPESAIRSIRTPRRSASRR